MPQIPPLATGTPIKIIGGPFAGLKGKIVPKHESPDDSGLLPAPKRDNYLVLVDMDGAQVETYLDRQEIEVISN